MLVMLNNFQMVYDYFQHKVESKDYGARSITGSRLGEFVQYTGNLTFLDTISLKRGEAYLLDDKKNGEQYCIGVRKDLLGMNRSEEVQESSEKEIQEKVKKEEEITFVFTLLHREEKMKRLFHGSSGSYLDVLSTYGVLHRSGDLYQVTFPLEIEEANISITNNARVTLSKDTKNTCKWVNLLEILV